MKVVLVIFCFFVATNAMTKEEIRKLFSDDIDDCQKETGATSDDVSSYKGKKELTTQNGKCLALCVHKKLKMQNDDGSVNADGLKEAAAKVKESYGPEAEKLDIVVDKCSKSAVSSDPCQAGADFYMCYTKEAQEVNVPVMQDV